MRVVRVWMLPIDLCPPPPSSWVPVPGPSSEGRDRILHGGSVLHQGRGVGTYEPTSLVEYIFVLVLLWSCIPYVQDSILSWAQTYETSLDTIMG